VTSSSPRRGGAPLRPPDDSGSSSIDNDAVLYGVPNRRRSRESSVIGTPDRVAIRRGKCSITEKGPKSVWSLGGIGLSESMRCPNQNPGSISPQFSRNSLPSAIAWAQTRPEEVLQSGRPLDAAGLAVAKSVGVAAPEPATRLPLLKDPTLREAAVQTGLLGPGMIGLTLGFAIYVVSGYESIRLLSHECRHVHQYEVAGSIAAHWCGSCKPY
jgi:hypothetical protein